MADELTDDFYGKVMQVIAAGNVNQALEMPLGLEGVDLKSVLLRLVRDLETELNHARVRAFESANTLVGANSSIRASAAIFALGLVRANTSATALHRVFDSSPDGKFDVSAALKCDRDIELELGKLSRTLKLEIELENELAKLIRMNTFIHRILEAVAT